MKNYKKLIRLLLAVIIGISSSTALHAQWGFTATYTISGKLCGNTSGTSPVNGIPSKSECESMRSMLMNYQFSMDGCKFTIRCTACTGSDIAGAQQSSTVPGKVTINGTETGQTIFSPNPGQSVTEWGNEFRQKIQSFGIGNTGNNVLLSGDKVVDEMYVNLMNESSENGDRLPTERGRLANTGIPGREDTYSDEKKLVVPEKFDPANTDIAYKAKEDYEAMKGWGEDIGVNLSDYMTKEEYDLDLKTATTEEIGEWNRKYDQYVTDCNTALIKREEERQKNLMAQGEDDSPTTFSPPNNVPVIAPGATVIVNKAPVAPEIDETNIDTGMRSQSTRNKIEESLKEIAKMDRFLNSGQLKSDDYQKRKEKAEQELKNAKDELIKQKKQESQKIIEKYRQELDRYQKERINCGDNKFCQNSIDQAIRETQEKIDKQSRVGFNYEIDAFADGRKNEIQQEESQRSDADKQCEIAYELIENGEVERGNKILDVYAPIYSAEQGAKYVGEAVGNVTEQLKTYTIDKVGEVTGLDLNDEMTRRMAVDAVSYWGEFGIGVVSTASKSNPLSGAGSIIVDAEVGISGNLVRQKWGTGGNSFDGMPLGTTLSVTSNIKNAGSAATSMANITGIASSGSSAVSSTRDLFTKGKKIK
jgi:hypothetical protein